MCALNLPIFKALNHSALPHESTQTGRWFSRLCGCCRQLSGSTQLTGDEPTRKGDVSAHWERNAPFPHVDEINIKQAVVGQVCYALCADSILRLTAKSQTYGIEMLFFGQCNGERIAKPFGLLTDLSLLVP